MMVLILKRHYLMYIFTMKMLVFALMDVSIKYGHISKYGLIQSYTR